ncbi:hypothetical protein FSP39_025074 [Pinctada imbricata]|uniref:Uncharacterized protein n=1 Tax=Pinctada imbricata TaxID=66713 RepID=A0AA89C8R3_PINIB|nr:hypothetical protein FSP39_025074 [Pinctada imbricata]
MDNAKDNAYQDITGVGVTRNALRNAVMKMDVKSFLGSVYPVLNLIMEGCSVGYYGELCDQVCDYCDNGLCKQYTGECKKENGTCVDKCALCDVENSRCLKCQKGFTGSECEVVCSKRCLNNACKSKANNCTDGCKDEYYGASCTQRCSTRCRLGKCDDKTSKCLVGCISGWLGEHCDGMHTFFFVVVEHISPLKLREKDL